MASTTSRVQVIEKLDRLENFDEDGGGQIIRTFYVEPYTSHKSVLTALKGTVRDGGSGTWERIPPHSDPLYPWFFCTDVKAVPFDKSAIRGGKSTQFNPKANDSTPTANGQLTEIKSALDKIDDFDFPSGIDMLSPSGILAGGTDNNDWTSGDSISSSSGSNITSVGKCGAFITATYRPLIILEGADKLKPYIGLATEAHGDGSGFDFVDPQIRPVILSTQVGASLRPLIENPFGGGRELEEGNGLPDQASIPEVLWEFTCRRYLVPFLPKTAFTVYPNKLNHSDLGLPVYPNEFYFPAGTVRCEAPEARKMIAPDGAHYWDILLRFTIRLISADMLSAASRSWQYRRITWNHQFLYPRSKLGTIALGAKGGYHPVGWTTNWTAFILGGLAGFRGMYLFDNDLPVESYAPPNPLNDSLADMWNLGFKKEY